MHVATLRVLKLSVVLAMAIIVNVFANTQSAAGAAHPLVTGVDAVMTDDQSRSSEISISGSRSGVDCIWHRKPCPCKGCKHSAKKSNTQLRRTKWLLVLKSQFNVWDPIGDVRADVAVWVRRGPDPGRSWMRGRAGSPFKDFYATTMRMLT